MSRIGRAPIAIPKGVDVDIKQGNIVSVKGPKGQLEQKFSPEITIEIVDGEVRVTRPTDHRLQRMQHGLTRALVNNMVTGVTSGFKKSLEIQGVGYRAEMQGKKLILHMGYSHPVEMDPPDGIAFKVENRGMLIIIEGIDKELVGLIAAKTRSVRPPEPYHGKGIRYAGENVRRKQGKTGK